MSLGTLPAATVYLKYLWHHRITSYLFMCTTLFYTGEAYSTVLHVAHEHCSPWINPKLFPLIGPFAKYFGATVRTLMKGPVNTLQVKSSLADSWNQPSKCLNNILSNHRVIYFYSRIRETGPAFFSFLPEVLGVIRLAGQPVRSSNWIWCQEAPDHDDNRG